MEKIEAENVNNFIGQFDVLVIPNIKEINLHQRLLLNGITILVVDGTLKLVEPPQGLIEISFTAQSDPMICIKKYQNENQPDGNHLTIIYIDHHKYSEKFPNQVLQLNHLLENVRTSVPEENDLILCTPRPDADSAAALYRFWVEKTLKDFNKGKYAEGLRIKRLEIFVKALEASAQWGDTFGFAENNFADFTKIELDSIRQIAKYLNRSAKDANGLQKGLNTLQEIFGNYLNGHKLELPLVQKMEYWRMMAQEQNWIANIQQLWLENTVSKEFYKKGLIYVDIFEIEAILKSSGSDAVVDAEIVCTAIFNLDLQNEILPYIVMKRKRNTDPGLSYYSFGSMVGHVRIKKFIDESWGVKCLNILNDFENFQLNTTNFQYFSGRNQAAGTINTGSSLSPKEVCGQLLKILDPSLKAPYNHENFLGNSYFGPFRNPVN